MKYRIKEVNGRFYPQYKWLCFWITFTEYYHETDIIVRMWTMTEARFFLDEYTNALKNKKESKNTKIKIHEYNTWPNLK